METRRSKEFHIWSKTLSEEEQGYIDGLVRAIEEHGASIGMPFCEVIEESKYKPNLLALHTIEATRILLFFCIIDGDRLFLVSGYDPNVTMDRLPKIQEAESIIDESGFFDPS